MYGDNNNNNSSSISSMKNEVFLNIQALLVKHRKDQDMKND
jgi:hypothetical protein